MVKSETYIFSGHWWKYVRYEFFYEIGDGILVVLKQSREDENLSQTMVGVAVKFIVGLVVVEVVE